MNSNKRLIEKREEVTQLIKTAAFNRDYRSLEKYAAGVSDLLMYYTYTQGHARRIFGGLNDRSFEKISQDDRDKAIWEPERERVKLRYYLQPEYQQVSQEARPVQSWGAPYLRRVYGNAIEGYFSLFASEEIQKTTAEVAAYPYDIIEFFKEQTVKQILEKEDYAFYAALNNLIAETETEGYGRSIYACYHNTFNHEDVINNIALHVDSAKRSQPKEFMIWPENVWVQLAKMPADTMPDVAQNAMDNGFGDKSATKKWGSKIVRVDDNSYALAETGSEHSKIGSRYSDDFEMYRAFGYNVTNDSDLKNKYGIDRSTTGVDSFIRVYTLPPENFLGKALLWGSDIKTHLSYEHDFVNFYSTEWLAYLFHNKYAPTAMDLWYEKR